MQEVSQHITSEAWQQCCACTTLFSNIVVDVDFTAHITGSVTRRSSSSGGDGFWPKSCKSEAEKVLLIGSLWHSVHVESFASSSAGCASESCIDMHVQRDDVTL